MDGSAILIRSADGWPLIPWTIVLHNGWLDGWVELSMTLILFSPHNSAYVQAGNLDDVWMYDRQRLRVAFIIWLHSTGVAWNIALGLIDWMTGSNEGNIQ